ncbi:carbon-nitrogen hydrolase family protein (plasmid) [Variovorax sp. V59]|uniref:carbon-nitrogen hydrolase family protein n=1 Tax=unclassified Variovorax TaxID=663243 RepID=UPI0034E87344
MNPAKPVKVAVVQAASVVFDTPKAMEKFARLAARAAMEGARLAVFPEAFIGSYPKGLDFGARVGSRTAAGRDDFVRYHQGAIEVPGPETKEMERICAELNLEIVVGVIEREGGTLYCTALFVSPSAGLVGKHRKLMPTAAERLVWGYGDGSTMQAFDSSLGRLGTVICWENYMPLLRMAMYAQGVEIYCAPTADDRDSWVPSMQHIALEGACFVLSACQVLRRSDCPEKYEAVQGNEPSTLLMRGGSCIVDPFGRLLAGPVFDEETILHAELDMDEIRRRKYDFDVVGHYARPDVFSMQIDTSRKAPVTSR